MSCIIHIWYTCTCISDCGTQRILNTSVAVLLTHKHWMRAYIGTFMPCKFQHVLVDSLHVISLPAAKGKGKQRRCGFYVHGTNVLPFCGVHEFYKWHVCWFYFHCLKVFVTLCPRIEAIGGTRQGLAEGSPLVNSWGGMEGGREGERNEGGREREGGARRMKDWTDVGSWVFSPVLTSALLPTPPLLSRPHSRSLVLPLATLYVRQSCSECRPRVYRNSTNITQHTQWVNWTYLI